MNDLIQSYWQTFQDTLPTGSPYCDLPYLAEGWGDDPAMADELGTLIAAGIKTATCSSVWEWQAQGLTWPEPGTLTVVLNGRDQPLCIVETREVIIKPYNEVDADFAFDEGEGDRSLLYWREVHRLFFVRSLAKMDRQFAEDMPLVCERFKLIYP